MLALRFPPRAARRALTLVVPALAAACAQERTVGDQPPEDTIFYPVTIERSGDGDVRSSDGTFDCGATCSATVPAGAKLAFSATPGASAAFAGWGGDCSGTGACSVIVTKALTIEASFADNPHLLTVGRTGAGHGNVTSKPSGIDCGATCSAKFAPGAKVTLTPSADPGSSFAGWEGACSGSSLCTVTMDADTTVTARFEAGGVLWAKRFGGGAWDRQSGTEAGLDVATDDDGDAIFVGQFVSSWDDLEQGVDFGGGLLSCPSATSPENVFAKLGPTGDHAWSRCVPSIDFPRVAAAKDGGAVALIGACLDNLDLDGHAVTCSSGGVFPATPKNDALVALFSGGGLALWARSFTSDATSTPTAVAIDDAGDVIVAGTFNATALDLGGGPIASAGSGTTSFLAKYAGSNGAHVWSVALGTTYVGDIAVLANGDVAVLGNFTGTATLGGDTLVSVGSEDMALGRFAAADGKKVWTQAFGTAGLDGAMAIASDGQGGLLVTGNRNGPHPFLAKYADTTGSEVWSHDFADTSSAALGAMAVDVAVNASHSIAITVAQELSDSLDGVDFGAGLVSGEFYLAEFGPDGGLLSAQPFMKYGDGTGQANAIALDDIGRVLLTGTFAGALKLGQGTLTSMLASDGEITSDIFIAQVAP